MKNLVEYFDAAYLINLPTRKDRLRSATIELARVGWKLGPEAVQLYAAQVFKERAGFPGSPSVRGCFHSHSECIRAAYCSDAKSVLLIEDDIALTRSIRQLTPSIISQLDSLHWDFVYFGHEHTGEIGRANSRTSEIRFIPISTEIRTTHFFAVHSRIYSRLLEHLDRVAIGREGDRVSGPMPIDGALNIFRRNNPDVRGFIANPKLGWQRPSRSEITPRPLDSVKSLRPFANVLRNFKYAVTRWRS